VEAEQPWRTGRDRLQTTMEFFERALGVAHQLLTFRAEGNATANPLEQHDPKRLFHLADRMADRARRQVQLHRCCVKRAAARGRFEYPQC
jgi:hypothetical protein